MKKCVTIFLLLCLQLHPLLLKAQDEPSSAPKINAFSLGPDNVGALANSVNLFSGELNLPMNLVSLPGGSGLGIDVSIFYNSSNIENLVDTWSLDAPTGILGLGWSMPLPSIVVDNKQTGARADDDFYLLEGGSSIKLICVGGTTTKSYKAKTNPNWTITYQSSIEKWEITKDDGTKYIYGDQNSTRSTVQWIVKWGNWIGDSYTSTNQGRQGLVWNLSEVKNVWGDKILYSYTNVDKWVGGGSYAHTEASYPYKITDQWGREVEFVLGDKIAGEFMEPHTENGADQTDAYQERYERKFLDKIVVRGGGTNFYEIKMGYQTNLLGSGNLTKRLLTSITKIAPNGEQLPPMSFSYKTLDPMKGALYQVTTQYGGTVTYDYHLGVDLAKSQRDKAIAAPSGYAEPRVFMDNAYSVVTWRQLNGGAHDTSGSRDVRVYAYSWEGRWIENDLGSIGSVKTTTEYEQDFQLATTSNHFAVLRPVVGQTTYWLYIWRRDDKAPGGWVNNSYNINLDSHDVEQERLYVGDNFVAVSNNEGKIFRYVWNGSSWNSDILTETTGRYYTGAANNYIITQNATAVKIHYLDEEKKWQSANLGTGFNMSAESYWYCANSFAFVMANGGNEYVFQWSDTYTSPQKIDLGFAYADNSYVRIINNNLIAIMTNEIPPNLTSTPTRGTMRAIRYKGNTWVDSGAKSIESFIWSSVGDDFFLWQSDGFSPGYVAYRSEYNPNSGSWLSDAQMSLNLIATSRIGYRNYGIDDQIFFRSPSGQWSNMTNPWGSYFVSGGDFYANGVGGIQFIKNNALTGTAAISGAFDVVDFSPSPLFIPNTKLLSSNTIITCQSAYKQNFKDATSLTFYRVVAKSTQGLHRDYPISKVTINDGGVPIITAFEYNASKATIDPSGTSPMYNMVTTIAGGGTSSSNTNGRTETYYFNTLSEADLGVTPGTSNGFPNVSPINIAAHLKTVTGLPYRTRVFNSLGTEVSLSETFWNANYLPFSNSVPAAVELGIVPRVYQTRSVQDGIEVQSLLDYSVNKHQLKTSVTQTKHTSGTTEVVQLDYIYAWEKYTSCVNANILSPIVQTTKKINTSTYTESSVTRWKDWTVAAGTIPAPYDNYTWKGTGSSTFTNWDVVVYPTASGSDWLFESRINSRESTYGRPQEVEGRGGQIKSTIWTNSDIGPLAEVSNAGRSNIYYQSWESGNSTDSKVGAKSYTSSMTVVLPSAGTFLLTYWRKPSGGAWQLIKQTISSNTVIGGAGYLIDEVRVHPASALMTTYNYDVMGQVISVNDANNMVSHKEYDTFGRPVLTRDQDRNIVQHNFYRFKN